ncbi:MAG: hypothetical protein MMC23_008203 [Stictis urceolatum]|nr:hypothetical protein [Stictis urceolata]
MSEDVLERFGSALRNTERLILAVSVSMDVANFDDYRGTLNSTCFQSLTTIGTELRAPKLSFQLTVAWYPIRFIADIFTWPRLQSLDLSQVMFVREKLASFPAKHSGTLRSVRLEAVQFQVTTEGYPSITSFPLIATLPREMHYALDLKELELSGTFRGIPHNLGTGEWEYFSMDELPVEERGIPTIGALLSALVRDECSATGPGSVEFNEKLNEKLSKILIRHCGHANDTNTAETSTADTDTEDTNTEDEGWSTVGSSDTD